MYSKKYNQYAFNYKHFQSSLTVSILIKQSQGFYYFSPAIHLNNHSWFCLSYYAEENLEAMTFQI